MSHKAIGPSSTDRGLLLDLRAGRLSPIDLAVFKLLQIDARAGGDCYVDYDELCQFIGRTQTTCRRSIKRLRWCGWISGGVADGLGGAELTLRLSADDLEELEWLELIDRIRAGTTSDKQ